MAGDGPLDSAGHPHHLGAVRYAWLAFSYDYVMDNFVD